MTGELGANDLAWLGSLMVARGIWYGIRAASGVVGRLLWLVLSFSTLLKRCRIEHCGVVLKWLDAVRSGAMIL